MENKETQKARRPLPTPGAIPAQRPNTPVPGALNASAVAPTNFYATTKTPAPPTRRSTIGTSYTTYIPPEDPPAYVPSYATPGFREPELVTEDTMESLPELTPSNSWDEKGESWDDNTWSSAPAPWGQYSYQSTSANAWSNNVSDDFNFDTTDYLSSASKPLVDVVIEGRDTYEENHWWDPAVREKAQRPGPGMLPPVLAEELHDPEHSLFSVSVTSPDIRVPNPPAASTSSTDQADQPPTSSPPRSLWGSSPPPSTPVPPSSPSTSISGPPPPPPSEEDVRTAVPHPNAYYCPKENGWVILSWKSSSVAPPLAKSFENSSHHPLPDQARRRRTESCIGDEQPFGRANKTHHFHKYEKAVDSHKLTPPFRREEWETMETVKQRRRTGTIMEDIDIKQIDPQDIDMMDETMPEEEEGRLLDLYVCCQCSFYCVASGVIPGVIPRKCFDEFVRDKKNNPQPGKSGEQGIVVAFETIIMIIENKLWKGENRLLRLTRTSFQNKVGWNTNIKRVFDVLGFVETLLDNESALKPPATDVATAEGRMNRRKLLRAWVEVSAWVADFKRIHAAHFKDSPKPHKLYVQIESAREMYQTAIGAHPDQIARGELSGSLLAALQPLHKEWESLGLTPMSYSSDLLAFGYYAQCRCDPAGTVNYFTHFSNIVGLMQNFPGCPQSLPEILATERSRDRFTLEDLVKAASVLGFGPEGPLGVDYDDEIPENFIENAWRECVKKSWRDPEHGSENLRFANEAFRVLAEARGSESLRKIWEAGKDRVMNPERAYDTLEVPKDVDDFMLITVYNMRMDEALSQTDKMREAMTVIAEVRDSERLRQFLDTGRDPGDIVAPIRPDLPRGLNQLGNTCYLNSLLQYFYTIKDLREAVMPMSKLDLKSLEDEKLSDDDLKRHRVGGRLVTRREILRSKKFINQLADLFFNLEYCETAAVTPTIELAKLALVTSRDEEEDEADKGGTDSSNDTDATLVDDVPPRVTMSEVPQSPARSPNSVLGKRARDVERHPSAMDLDSSAPASPNRDAFVSTPSPRTSSSPPPLQSPGSSTIQPEASGSGSLSQIEVDVEMRATPAPGSKPPPLPPRKPVETSDSVMMFGKQHDVAECMDNCMFQIETALLKFDGLTEAQAESSDKTSVVKRLFYGRLRQRLTGNQPSGSSVHEKEDLFSHLPVNVTDDGVDIYDGLSGYFDDVVDFDGEKRRMEVTLIDLPPVLQIQLQRVQFNRETLQPYKSQAYVKFRETIYMDRFMDNADPQKKAQSKVIQTELNACRDRIRLLVEGKDGPYVSALENTTSFLSKVSELAVDVDDDLLYQLNDEQVVLKTEIDELRARADRLKDELEAIWRDNTEIAYELTSVFIHRGSSPSWGHYFFYSRHLPDHPDSWFKYNDSDVTVVSKDEVLADTTGSTANPYLLVFARKGSEVVDTVKRFDATMIDML